MIGISDTQTPEIFKKWTFTIEISDQNTVMFGISDTRTPEIF